LLVSASNSYLLQLPVTTVLVVAFLVFLVAAWPEHAVLLPQELTGGHSTLGICNICCSPLL